MFLNQNANYIAEGYLTQRINQLVIIALFGSIIFVANMFLPPPINYLMMVVQALFLALSALFIKKAGAMYVGAIGGLLTTLLSGSALGPFTFIFAFLYGVFVDLCLFIFRVKGSRQGVNRNRLIAAMAVATLLIAISSYSAFAIYPQSISWTGISYVGLFIQRSPMLDMMVLFMGPAVGAVAGYAAAYLWNKYLRHMSV